MFLDEITEMASEVQAKFLRVLEEGQVRRIGGTANIPVSVRVVAATNRPPSIAVKEGKLRQDLFYRLSVFHLELPPLREEARIFRCWLATFSSHLWKSTGKHSRQPTSPHALGSHSWPGNVRELRNAMERLAVMAPVPILRPKISGSFV